MSRTPGLSGNGAVTPAGIEQREARRPLRTVSGPVRLPVGDARRWYPQIGAALDAPDVRAFLAGWDATGLAARVAELQALER